MLKKASHAEKDAVKHLKSVEKGVNDKASRLERHSALRRYLEMTQVTSQYRLG